MKKSLLIIAVAISTTLSYAQAPTIEWQNTFGGSAGDNGNVILQTTDGGYILGGESRSDISGNKTENSYGSNDFWIIKLNSLGVIEWQNTIGGDNNDRATTIDQTLDGGYIIGGFSNSNISGDKTEDSRGSYDYWIVKLNTSGNIEWQKTIGGNASDFIYNIKQTADEGYILGGHSYSNISGDKTENNNGEVDYWLVKIDSSGNIEWQNTIGGDGGDYANVMRQTTDGGYIIGGESGSNISGDKTENSYGLLDYWVVKINVSGVIEWDKTIGGNLNDRLFTIEQSVDGGFILGGISNSNISGNKTENSYGGDDYWAVKINTTGTIEWQKTLGGSSDDILLSIIETSNSGYVLTGFSASNISGIKTENSKGQDDYWVLKIDMIGSILWQKTIGGLKYDYLSSSIQTNDGGFALFGSSDSDISGDKTENSYGLRDYWVVKLEAENLSVEENSFIKAIAFPNPNNGKFTIDLGKQYSFIDATMVNLLGQNIFSKTFTNTNTIEIDVNEISGIYLLQLKDNSNKIATLKIIIN